MATGAELECQNPAKSFVGIDRIRLARKLWESALFAEGLHEGEQNKKVALSYLARAVCKKLMQYTVNSVFLSQNSPLLGKKIPNKIWENNLKYCFSRECTFQPCHCLPSLCSPSFGKPLLDVHKVNSCTDFIVCFYTAHLDALHFFLGRPTLKAARPPGFLRPASRDLHGRDQLHLHLGFWRLHSYPDHWAEALQHRHFAWKGTTREDNKGKKIIFQQAPV